MTSNAHHSHDRSSAAMPTLLRQPSLEAASARGSFVRLQRQCACGQSAGLAGRCTSCERERLVGRKAPLAPSASLVSARSLPIGERNDRFEQEADRAADAVMQAGAMPKLEGAVAGLQARSANRDAAGRRQGAGQHGQAAETCASEAEAPPVVHEALASSARGLDAPTRAFMEPHFGRDFSQVRVHDDSLADESARAVGANAFTVGPDIVFAAGRFAPGTDTGRRLLAHELAHVVQQGAGPASLQRDNPPTNAPPTAGKRDVSIVLSDDDQDMSEGRSYAKTVLRVTSTADAAAQLKALGVPIGKLFVVSHSSAAGKVRFSSSIGTLSWVSLPELAKDLKGAASIDDVDFRGCKLGDASGAMESFRKTMGAQSTSGSNCWTFIQRATPLDINGVDVTSPSQIPETRQGAFNAALLRQLGNMRSADGKPVQNCLVGLAPGERADARSLPKIWKLYWENGGNLIASWASPEYNEKWQRGSICSKDMTASTTPCAIVKVEAPKPSAPAAPAGGKTGSLGRSQPGIEVADGASASVPGEEPA
ncbi:conserved hypothetical protein [Burkholderiales bacterium 8X]|nr:conserved hypothetical protein [Burkholderiales bacterium 8X]